MKSVVLIGDSIRMGYQEAVSTALPDQAEVWGPEENGETSSHVLSCLDEWVIDRNPDVVHINCGLHDIKREFGQDDIRVPLADYTDNLRAILNRVTSETHSKVIWALTTPVNQAWHHENKPFDRLEADVAAYNAAALKVAREFDVAVNDLFGVVTSAGRDELLLPDGVHFKPEGYTLLGKHVAASIGDRL